MPRRRKTILRLFSIHQRVRLEKWRGGELSFEHVWFSKYFCGFLWSSASYHSTPLVDRLGVDRSVRKVLNSAIKIDQRRTDDGRITLSTKATDYS